MRMKKQILPILLLITLLVPAYALELEEEDLDITEVVIEPEEENPEIQEADGSITITVTCTGDFTIGGDNRSGKKNKKYVKQFYNELKKNEDDINFTMANVRDIFEQDDLTLVNFEGTLTDSTYIPSNKKENDFIFNISPSYVSVLPENGIEAVSLENNHVMDHGEDAYTETKETLRNAGIVYSNSEEPGIFEAKGIQIAMLSYLCIDRYDKPVGQYANLYEKVAADIRTLKDIYPIVIVSFHWGNEKDYYPTDRQKKMGRLAVDSGADLVVGHHSHRMNPIELYNGVYICYSLGNFCFSGHERPGDMSSFIFQTRFRITKNGDISNSGFRIIPIRISSNKDTNNYTPTPYTNENSIFATINTLKENGAKHLDYPVADYPLEWK